MERCLACEADRSGTIGGARFPNEVMILTKRRVYFACLHLDACQPQVMAGSYFIRCHVLDPRLGEFTGLRWRKASRSFLSAAFVYWPFGSLAPPAVPTDRPRKRGSAPRGGTPPSSSGR